MTEADAGERSDQPVRPTSTSAESGPSSGASASSASSATSDRPAEAPAQKAPASKGPADKTPAEKPPTDKGPTDRAPTDKGPGEKSSGASSDPSSRADGSGEGRGSGSDDGDRPEGGGAKKRRRGSRGGRNRNRNRAPGEGGSSEGEPSASDRDASEGSGDGSIRAGAASSGRSGSTAGRSGDTARTGNAASAGRAQTGTGPGTQPELPDRHRENKPSPEAAERALVRKPQIGDSRPAPVAPPAAPGTRGPGGAAPTSGGGEGAGGGGAKRRRRRGGRGRGGSGGGSSAETTARSGSEGAGASSGTERTDGGRSDGGRSDQGGNRSGRSGRGRSGRGRGAAGPPVTAITDDEPVDLDEKTLRKRRGRERKGKPVGRYLMAVHVQPAATQIAVLEGRSLIEHYVSRPSDGVSQIHGNVYLGKVQNVLPGMEAAFIDIGTPKNAVLYRGDTRHDPEDLDKPSDVKAKDLRIEQILRPRQNIISQVTKNPIGAKGARLTQEVSLPGRFVVLVPNSSTYGISKRLPDPERKRLRQILDRVKPKGHGLIVRTAAEGISAQELERDVERLAQQWSQIEALAARSSAPAVLYQEPDMAVRVIREEFNSDYRQVVIDDDKLFEEVRDYVRSISPALVDRVERYDPAAHGNLPIFEAHHVHEQLHKALDRKVWLPSGGSLIIERTEALTVIDVNTGKNVGRSSLEETVFRNNLEAAEEVARQLRLRDIGGIIVIDFIDMEIKANREKVISTFREALSRDKTRTQVFDISELGLVEMTRKRIGEGLMESLSGPCPHCEGRGMVFDRELIGD